MPNRMTTYTVALPARTPWNDGPGVMVALKPEPWTVDALCAQTGLDLHFPETGEPVTEAKAVCAACDVRAQCLEYALDRNEVFGVWGGLSPQERKRLRRPIRPPRKVPKREPTPKHMARLELYRAGATDAQIAVTAGVRRTVIESWRQYHKLPPNRG